MNSRWAGWRILQHLEDRAQPLGDDIKQLSSLISSLGRTSCSRERPVADAFPVGQGSGPRAGAGTAGEAVEGVA